MGARSTKFGFFNTRQMKFLAGQKLRLLHMYEEAPDSEENTRTVYADRISPGISELKKSSIVRLCASSKHVVAGAIVHTQVPIILPLFMDWDAQPPDDLNSDTNTSAAPLSEKAAISENLEAALKESEGEEFILRMPDMDSDSDSCKELFESELEDRNFARQYPAFLKVVPAKVPQLPLGNQNIASFFRLVSSEKNLSSKRFSSIVTVNFGGAQMSRVLWGRVFEFLKPKCPRKNAVGDCSCRQNEGVYEAPYFIHSSSIEYIGGLKFPSPLLRVAVTLQSRQVDL